MGLSFVNILLDWSASTTYIVRRSSDIQSSDRCPQSNSRRSSCGMCTQCNITLSLDLCYNAYQSIKEAHGQTGWLETCARAVATDSARGMSKRIRSIVNILTVALARLRRSNPNICPIHPCQAPVPSSQARIRRIVWIRRIHHPQGYRWSKWRVRIYLLHYVITLGLYRSQLRNNFRPHGPSRSNRLFPENDLRSLPSFRQ